MLSPRCCCRCLSCRAPSLRQPAHGPPWLPPPHSPYSGAPQVCRGLRIGRSALVPLPACPACASGTERRRARALTHTGLLPLLSPPCKSPAWLACTLRPHAPAAVRPPPLASSASAACHAKLRCGHRAAWVWLESSSSHRWLATSFVRSFVPSVGWSPWSPVSGRRCCCASHAAVAASSCGQPEVRLDGRSTVGRPVDCCYVFQSSAKLRSISM